MITTFIFISINLNEKGYSFSFDYFLLVLIAFIVSDVRKMEASMKAICNGVRTKEDVLRENIIMYRDAFSLASQNFIKLEEVLLRD